jgi:hypothetical protein
MPKSLLEKAIFDGLKKHTDDLHRSVGEALIALVKSLQATIERPESTPLDRRIAMDQLLVIWNRIIRADQMKAVADRAAAKRAHARARLRSATAQERQTQLAVAREQKRIARKLQKLNEENDGKI